MTTTITKPTMLEALEHDEAERAHKLVDGALKRSGLSKAELRAALPAGFGKVAYRHDHPSTWPAETAHDRALIAVGRLLLRLRNELFVPLESLTEPSALAILTELLT